MKMRKKILIVDDKPENIIALETMLRESGVDIFKSTSGNDALMLTLEHDFALALIDVQMPEMDGFETVRLLRKADRTRFLPVIFLSAIYSEEHYKIQGIEAGAVDFITKPFVPRMVLGKIRIFLDLYENKKMLEEEIEQRKRSEASLRETERKLLMALNKAEESDRLKTAFLANVSHEIKTPLTSIIGFSDLLADTDLDIASRKKYSKIISKSGESLMAILNDIIDLSKIETNQFAIVLAPADINKILGTLNYSYNDFLNSNSKPTVTLTMHLPDNPVKTFMTDGLRLKQAISNLLSNAIKFTPEGQIHFGYTSNTAGISFFVRDTGIGIPADKIDRIFERFHKLDNIINSSGTGLGLPIVKKIVELLGGTIEVNSELNKGSEFLIHLPANKSGEITTILKNDNDALANAG